MNRIMLAITILHKIHCNCYKCKTSKLDANKHSNTVVVLCTIKWGVIVYTSNYCIKQQDKHYNNTC